MTQHRYITAICATILIVAVFITYRFYEHTSTRWTNNFKSLAARNNLIPDYPAYYAKLGEAFQQGQTHLLNAPSSELLALQNPFDWGERRAANVRYLWDATLYDGKYYLYFGPVPALIPWIPVQWLLGISLPDRTIALFYLMLGTCSLMLLLYRFAKQLGVEKLAPYKAIFLLLIAALPLCFGTTIPLLLKRPMFYEAAIASAYGYTALGLLCMWFAYGENTKYATLWKVMASLCLGLAAGCRLFHALNIILLLSCWIAPAWRYMKQRNYRKAIHESIALFLPWLMVLIGVALYNYARFGSIFETGISYQLSAADMRHFTSHWSWTSFTSQLYDYLLTPITANITPWSEGFGKRDPEIPFGLILYSPFFLLAGAILFQANHLHCAHRHMSTLLLAISIYAILCCIFILAYSGTKGRYMFDFAPWFMVVACAAFLYGTLHLPHAWQRKAMVITGLMLSVWTTYSGLAAFSCIKC